MADIPKVLEKGVTFLRFLKEPFGIIPIRIVSGKKRPMVKIKGHDENITRYSDGKVFTATLDTWERAEYYGIITSPRYNPNITKQLMIVDVDVPSEDGHKSDGREHISKLDIQDTLTIQTASGGAHYYYWMPLGYKVQHKPYDGIDIVHMSPFYAIGPGNRGYTITNKRPITDASAKLLEQLKYKPSVSKTTAQRSSIIEDISKGVPSGQRHDMMLKLMGSMVGRHVPKDISLIVGDWAIQQCDQSDGVPTKEEIESQYDDALTKFDTKSKSFETIMEDLVLITSLDKVKRCTNPSAAAINLGTIQIHFPHKVPNINKPPRADGTFAYEPMGKVWRESDSKKTVDWLGYYPNGESVYSLEGLTYFNTYNMPVLPEPKSNELLIQLFQRVFKRTYGPIYEDWLKVIKYKHLHPETKFNWCIYVTSIKEGTGKGLSYKFTQSIFGKSNCLDVKMHAFEERFNNSWTESTFALVDEAHGSVTRSSRNKVMNAIKRIITEDSMTIERKGAEKQIGVPSFFFLYIFSNDSTSLDLNRDSRRFLVYHDFEKVTINEKKRMNQLAPHLMDPRSVATILKWIVDTVDIEITDDFNPKGEARKTSDLLGPQRNTFITENCSLVIEDMDNGADIFKADILTTHQLEYYCTQRFGPNQYGRLYHELKQLKVLTTIPAPTPSNSRIVKKIYISKLDMSLCKNGIDIRDAYLPDSYQYNIVVLRDFEKWSQARGPELHDEINKNGPRRRNSVVNSVDK